MKIEKRVEDRIRSGATKFRKVLDIARNRDLNESDTVAIINDMLSEMFGYAKYLEITGDLIIRGTYCALAIRLNGKFENGFLIECKRMGEMLTEEHMSQAANCGIQWVVLTNGIEWRLYRIRFEQPVGWDLVVSFSFESSDAKCEQDLEKLFCLCKEGVKKGAREKLFKKIQCGTRSYRQSGKKPAPRKLAAPIPDFPKLSISEQLLQEAEASNKVPAVSSPVQE